MNTENYENNINEEQPNTKLPKHLSWPFICLMYALFYYLPVLPIFLNIKRLLFNKKHPEYKNNGGKKSIAFFVALFITVITSLYIYFSIDEKKYEEAMSAITSGNLTQAEELLNKNFPEANGSYSRALWFAFYKENGEYNKSAEVYFEVIENTSDILNCEYHIDRIKEIEDNLNQDNKDRLNKIKEEFKKAKKASETTTEISTAEKKKEEKTTVIEPTEEITTKKQKEEKTTATKPTEEATTPKKEEKTTVTEPTEEITTKKQKEEKTTTTKPTEETTVKKLSKEDKQFVKDWINENLGSEKISWWQERKLKKVADEEQFSKIFYNLLQDATSSYSEPNYSFVSVVKSYCRLYKLTWTDSTKANKLYEYIIDLDEGIDELRSIEKEITANFKDGYVGTGEFYVKERFSNAYIDKLFNETRTQWLAYNPAYIALGNFPGVECYILSMPPNKTFPNKGIYNLSYIATGETVKLTNSDGFETTVPLYYVIDDADDYEMLYEQKSEAESYNLSLFLNIKDMINGTDPNSQKGTNNNKYKYMDAAPEWVFKGSIEEPYKVCTGGSTLNIRTGPDASYEKIGSLEDGCDVAVLEIYNGWAYITKTFGVDGFAYSDYSKDLYGWISADYIEKIPYSP